MGLEGSEYDDSRLIRVRYSTIINYISQIYRLIIAVAFTIIATRKLSVEEYGLYTTILGVLSSILMYYDIWGYWSRRFYARGKKTICSTVIILNLMYVPIAMLIMFVIGLYYNYILGNCLIFFLLVLPRIVIAAFNRYFRSISASSRPYIIGKVNMVYESIRIILAYIFVAILLWRLTGILLSIVIASLVSTISHFLLLNYYGLKIPRPKINLYDLKILLFNSYIPLISSLYIFLSHVEKPILTAITASTIVTAYLGVSYIPRNVILQGGYAFTSGLYARLLRSPSKKDIEDILRICIFVNIGVSFLLFALSTSILSLFRTEYIKARILFVLFIIESLFITASSIFTAIATSREERDLYVYGKELMKTPLFKIPLIRLIRGVFSIIVGSLAVYALFTMGIKDPILLALPYPLAWFISSIPYTIYTYKQAIKKSHFSIPWRDLLIALFAGSISALSLHLLNYDKLIIRSFWNDLPELFIAACLGISLYTIIIYSLSPWVREFINLGLSYINKRLNKSI